MNGEAGLINVRQRQLVLVSFRVPHRHPGIRPVAGHRYDFHFDVASERRKSLTPDRRPSSHEPHPVPRCPERAVEPRRGHFQHIPAVNDSRRRVQRRLDGPRRPLAVPNLHLGAIDPIDPDVEHRPTAAATDPNVDDLNAERLNCCIGNSLQPVFHVVSLEKTGTKKCGAPSPTSLGPPRRHPTCE